MTISPARFGAGPVVLIIANQTGAAQKLTVETDAWEEFKDGSAKVTQTIYLARDNHKAIVIGKGGSRIKQVREAAQAELQQMMDRQVHLFLFVKVRENWQEDPERYREMGLEYPKG